MIPFPGEPIHVSGPSTRFGNDQRKFSVISFTSPGNIKCRSNFLQRENQSGKRFNYFISLYHIIFYDHYDFCS